MLEFFILAILAFAIVCVTLAVTRRRAERRADAVSRGARVRLPCRVSWQESTKRKSFVYGKIEMAESGTGRFIRPFRSPIAIPAGRVAAVKQSWRPGVSMLSYQPISGPEIRILLSEADADALRRGLSGDYS